MRFVLLLLAAFPLCARAEESVFTQPHDQFLKAVTTIPRPSPRPVGSSPTDDALLLESIEPILTTLEGIPAVMVRNEDGSVRKVSPGELLRNGDSFQTGDFGSARISFHEGSEVLVGRDSVVSVGEQYATSVAGVEAIRVPEVYLQKGEVRAMVNREADMQARPKASWFRFFVRTPTSVLGVRGTDFVVSVDSPENMEVHTLNGEVDVAGSHRELRSMQGVAVPAGNFTNTYVGKNGRGINRPRTFEVNEYLSRFHVRHPKLEEMWKRSVGDRKNRRVSERFRGIRNQRRQKRKAR